MTHFGPQHIMLISTRAEAPHELDSEFFCKQSSTTIHVTIETSQDAQTRSLTAVSRHNTGAGGGTPVEVMCVTTEQSRRGTHQ